ncbi:unnamed protein product [Meloidogyne enterolobii]|uniref:Uncharacterized protein n=1 Tax=Meloidogyne enterolobii TaxID=390850 RepID=A0ACB0XKB6_MELEN
MLISHISDFLLYIQIPDTITFYLSSFYFALFHPHFSAHFLLYINPNLFPYF